MLTNATITRIDRRGAPDAAGRPRFIEGGAVSIRCAMDQVSGRQRYTLGAVLQDATLVVHLERTALSAAGESPPDSGDRIVIQSDAEAQTQTVTIITTGDRLGPEGLGLSHIELFVRREPV